MNTHNTGFGLSINAREDGTLEAAYVQLAEGKVARTQEIGSSMMFDFSEDNTLIGIELLAPISVSQARKIAENLEASMREPFNNFIKKYAPKALVTT